MGRYGFERRELTKIFSLVGMGVFGGILVNYIKDYLVQFGHPVVISVTGLIIFAYVFNLN